MLGKRCLHAGIIREAQSLDALYSTIWDCSPDIGVVAAYVGRVKGPGKALRLEIVNETLAADELKSIVEAVAEKYENIRGIILYTHVGLRREGQPIVYILVAAVDRSTAINALRELVDAYKSTKFIKHVEVEAERG